MKFVRGYQIRVALLAVIAFCALYKSYSVVKDTVRTTASLLGAQDEELSAQEVLGAHESLDTERITRADGQKGGGGRHGVGGGEMGNTQKGVQTNLGPDSEAVNHTPDQISISSDIDKRGKWQKKQVEAYCRKYGLTRAKYQFPSDGQSKTRLFRHVIFDDERNLLFTYLPKVGCANIRRFLFLLQGVIPPETMHWERPLSELESKYLEPAVGKHSFLVKTMNDSQKMERVKKYYKVTVLRNPLERLLSAFRDKLESPLVFRKPGWTQTQTVIVKKFGDVKELEKWTSSKGSFTLQVTFSQYIQWIIDIHNSILNEHFSPQIDEIYPCRMVYDFFGNFNQLGKDMAMIINKLDAPMEYYNNTSYHNSSLHTSSLLEEYYSQLSTEVKHALFRDFYQELDFYYHLYPEERTSHCKLLETDELIQ